jgi:hypothetical protein
MFNQFALALLCLLFLLPVQAAGQVDPLLDHAINKLKPDAELGVSMATGDIYLGQFSGRQNDQLLLTGSFDHGEPGSTVTLPLADIVRLQVSGSGAGRGFKAGFTTGAVVGGSLSLLWGLALSSLDSDDDNTMGIIGFTMLGTMAGGIGFGSVGAGIGALTDAWYTVYESPDARFPPDRSGSRDTRVALGLGLASGYQDREDYQQTGLYGTGGLQVPVGSLVEVGPELAYYHLGGSIEHHQADYTYFTSVSPVVSIGLAASLQPRKSGWAPYLVAGTGYYFSEGEYLGLSLGGGLRFRTAGDQEARLEIRNHFSIYDDGHNFVLDHFLTLGANFSFGL